MIKVNLLSPERKEVSGASGGEGPSFKEDSREKKISNGAILGAIIITLGTIAFMYITQHQTLDEKKNLLDEKNAEKTRLKHVEETLRTLEQTQKMLNRKVALIGELKSKKLATVKMMDAVSGALPEWVWLNSLSFSGNRLNLNGRAIHNNLIADFINNLKTTNNFTDIQFQSSTRQKQSGMDVFAFSLSCNFKGKTIGGKVK